MKLKDLQDKIDKKVTEFIIWITELVYGSKDKDNNLCKICYCYPCECRY